MNFYNDIDPKVCAWTQELIKAGFIPPGDVVCKSVSDINPDELTKYTQCHFFNGISGWAFALTLAGWPEDRPVWCASLPCQPFSVAGKGRGTEDERHLWPVFAELIRACKPPVVFGEQVASKAGRDWLAGVFADLEGMAYQRAGADLCAAGVGAPHIRQRLYWVAHSKGERLERPAGTQLQGRAPGFARGGNANVLANSDCERHHGQHPLLRQNSAGRETGDFPEAARSGQTGGLADGHHSGLEGRSFSGNGQDKRTFGESGVAGWTDSKPIQCRDGKTRRAPTEPAFFPLVDGFSPARMVILRGAGNAIVPQVAAEFVGAYLDCFQEDWI